MKDRFTQELKTQMALRGVSYDAEKVLANMSKVFVEVKTTVKDATIEFVNGSVKYEDKAVEYFGKNEASSIIARMKAATQPQGAKKTVILITGKTDIGDPYLNTYLIENLYETVEYVHRFLSTNEDFGTRHPVYFCFWEDLTSKLYH